MGLIWSSNESSKWGRKKELLVRVMCFADCDVANSWRLFVSQGAESFRGLPLPNFRFSGDQLQVSVRVFVRYPVREL